MKRVEREALRRILDYIEPDEARDYEDQEGSDRDSHIYLDVIFLREYLNRKS